jgi:hypothetical protein
MTPLIWVYAARTHRWVAMVAESNERLQTHRCDVRRERSEPWEPNPEAAERSRRHMAGIREVMGWGPNPFIEEGERRGEP